MPSTPTPSSLLSCQQRNWAVHPIPDNAALGRAASVFCHTDVAVPAHPRPERADLASLAKIPADKAMAAAQAAYPRSRVRSLALENDNGCLVYGVLLSNGMEVKIDAGNGLVLLSEGGDDGDNRTYEIK